MKLVRQFILGFIDLFYPPFKNVFTKQTFRYLACGGGNTLLDILLYFLFYNFVLEKQAFEIGGIAIGAHIAAFIFSFSITFPLGFFLSKYIVFSESTIKGRIQLLRYAMLVASCIMLNYVFLKLFVEVLHFYPTIAKIITTALVAIYSYYAQRKFTFKVQKEIVVK